MQLLHTNKVIIAFLSVVARTNYVLPVEDE